MQAADVDVQHVLPCQVVPLRVVLGRNVAAVLHRLCKFSANFSMNSRISPWLRRSETVATATNNAADEGWRLREAGRALRRRTSATFGKAWGTPPQARAVEMATSATQNPTVEI